MKWFRRKPSFAMVVALVLLPLVAIAIHKAATSNIASKYAKVVPGMNEMQVIDILGSHLVGTIEIEDRPPAEFARMWSDGDYFLYVWFDSDGKVLSKELEERYKPKSKSHWLSFLFE